MFIRRLLASGASLFTDCRRRQGRQPVDLQVIIPPPGGYETVLSEEESQENSVITLDVQTPEPSAAILTVTSAHAPTATSPLFSPQDILMMLCIIEVLRDLGWFTAGQQEWSLDKPLKDYGMDIAQNVASLATISLAFPIILLFFPKARSRQGLAMISALTSASFAAIEPWNMAYRFGDNTAEHLQLSGIKKLLLQALFCGLTEGLVQDIIISSLVPSERQKWSCRQIPHRIADYLLSYAPGGAVWAGVAYPLAKMCGKQLGLDALGGLCIGSAVSLTLLGGNKAAELVNKGLDTCQKFTCAQTHAC